KNVLALTYWSYQDALIQSYTLPYLRIMKRYLPAGSKIYLVTLEQQHLKMTREEREESGRKLAEEGIHLIAFDYSRFGLKAMIKWPVLIIRLLALCYRRRVTHLHAWCTPAGGVGYILSRLTGIPLFLDSFEPHAESMVENGTWRKGGLAFKVLFLLEKLKSRHAQAAIATTEGVRGYAKEKYGASPEKFYVKPASVDLEMFSARFIKDAALLRQFDLCGKVVCVYAGKIGGIYLEREIFDFFKAASSYWGDRFRALLLTSADEAKIRGLAVSSGLDPEIIISRFVEHKDIARYMGLGDFAINPVKPVPTKRYCTSIKDGEYWAMGLPVVIPPNISDDSDIIKENRIGSVIVDFTEQSYLNAIKEIDELLKKYSREELFDKIRSVAVKYRSISETEKIYRELYGDPV
ncbi:MAG TPA: glycosyltransferase, partial [Pyrinomonadaceae bacterium]|nr:glycosyltransferase [Pyrinomonadaceae bacterium]